MMTRSDGHTIDKAKEQAQHLYGRFILLMTGDRGYRGQNMSGKHKNNDTGRSESNRLRLCESKEARTV